MCVFDHAVTSGLRRIQRSDRQSYAIRQPVTPSRPSQKHGDGVENFAGTLEEPLLVKPRREEDVFEFFHGVPGVLGFDPIVPCEEGDLECGQAGGLDLEQAILQLLPEAGGGPVFDGEARPFGDLVVLAANRALKLVAKRQDVGTPMPAFSQVVEAETERFADGEQPFEVGGPEPEQPAVDRSLGAHQVGVAFPFLGLVGNLVSRRDAASFRR